MKHSNATPVFNFPCFTKVHALYPLKLCTKSKICIFCLWEFIDSLLLAKQYV